MAISFAMASTDCLKQVAEISTKVLRRTQVSKVHTVLPDNPHLPPRLILMCFFCLVQMTRTLQNRLALASVKIKYDWESVSLDTLELRVRIEL